QSVKRPTTPVFVNGVRPCHRPGPVDIDWRAYDQDLAACEWSTMPVRKGAVFVTLTGIAVAQGNSPGKGASAPKFDVASIKPVAARSDVTRTRWSPGGRVDLHNVTIEELMVNAWHIFPDQIVGAPGWIRTAAYDISAKPETSAKASEVNLMMQ